MKSHVNKNYIVNSRNILAERVFLKNTHPDCGKKTFLFLSQIFIMVRIELKKLYVFVAIPHAKKSVSYHKFLREYTHFLHYIAYFPA